MAINRAASSKELVGSSRINISGFDSNDLARPILCFSPPEIFSDFSPIFLFERLLSFLYSSFNSHFFINSFTWKDYECSNCKAK